MVAVRRLWVATSGEIPVLIQRRPNSAVAERCRSGRTGRSRKPLSLLRGTEGSNPSLSATEPVPAAGLPERQRGLRPPLHILKYPTRHRNRLLAAPPWWRRRRWRHSEVTRLQASQLFLVQLGSSASAHRRRWMGRHSLVVR